MYYIRRLILSLQRKLQKRYRMAVNEHWIYRGEGNVNMVLSDIKQKKVYRFVKTNVKCENNFEHNKRTVDFVKEVMQPLLSSVYVIPPLLEKIPIGFAEKVNRAVKKARPAHRKGKDIDFAARAALVLPDFCYVFQPNCISSMQSNVPYPATISIEIKPKSGFIPISNHIKNPIKFKVCKFCMRSHLKSKNGLWLEQSRYCPVDLFSGNPSRVRHAIHELLNTPQNNLKICKNGVEVYSEYVKEDLSEILGDFLGEQVQNAENANMSCLDVFINLVVDALHYPMDTCTPVHYISQKSQNQSQRCLNSSYRSTPDEDTDYYFPPGCILEKILSVQYLDDLDIEGIYPLYQQLQKHFQKHPEDRQKYCLDGPYRGDNWYVVSNNNNIEDAGNSDILYTMIKVKQFLVAQTVKDCSIILAMQRQDNRSDMSGVSYLTDCFGQPYKHSLAIIDLDPKPYEKIPVYMKEDETIVNTYLKSQFAVP
ncbi:inositol-pentakisphosphate 2-kinase isoform X3 [Octopus sinensis]|uniref:Inositol-pentakisphosphate 2-kinase n=1 Tax=Octopus sinensis TaxID=2607531 RepID=A0A6P7SGE4_9MOLL|nr:inositol-pentakisphosphate 2-kinase isoform X3 [Octopus sinensis]